MDQHDRAPNPQHPTDAELRFATSSLHHAVDGGEWDAGLNVTLDPNEHQPPQPRGEQELTPDQAETLARIEAEQTAIADAELYGAPELDK